MTLEEWNELEIEPELTNRWKELMKKTEVEDEHPENYNGPCFCKLCQSYSDFE